MKNNGKARVWPAAFILAGLFLGGSSSPPKERQGSSADPSREDLFSVYKNIHDIIPSSFPHPSSLPLLKKSRGGQVWAAWEEWGNNCSEVNVGRIRHGRLASVQALGRPGFNISPELAFDANGAPWAIWVNYLDQEYKIFVRDIASRKTWRLNSRPFFPATSPRLLFDRGQRAWAFWNETGKKRGEIVFRILDQGQWSQQKILALPNQPYALDSEAAVDSKGNVWVTWSSYDGNDYEIYLTHWNGEGWRRIIQITDNQENDGFPAIGFDQDNLPLVSWSQSSGLGRQICFVTFQEGAPPEEIKIACPQNQPVIPRLVQDDEKTGLIWNSPEGVVLVTLSADSFEQKEPPVEAASPLSLIYNPVFDESRYVCFGDSITKGFIDREPAPELGYVPRLDILLDQNFGLTETINEGLGAEDTFEGLVRIDSVISSRAGRYFLILEGTNDIIHNRISMDASAFNLREIVRKCLAAGAFPAVATILPRQDWYGMQKFYSDRILYLNERIREIARDFPVSFVDMYGIFHDWPSSDGGLASLLSNDKKHPSHKGYQAMAESWFGEIKAFPFPPVNVRLIERSAESLFHPKRLSLPRQESSGASLAWKDSPKIFDAKRIKGYKIYRKNKDFLHGRFRFAAFVSSPSMSLDLGARPSGRFIYAVSGLRTDGVEGPCSQTPDE